MELNRLWNMDCIAGMQELEPGSIDLAFADPPFNIGYEYDVYEDKRAAEDYLSWTERWGEALRRALKPTGTFWLAIGDDFAAELKLIFQRKLGFTCRSWVIWYYTFGVNCKQKFSRSHTHLFHFVRNPRAFTFNSDDIRVPSARQLVYADVRADSRGRLPDDTWILRPQDLPDGFQADEDTWYIPRVCGTFKERAGWHGCQMPEQLLGRIIKSCSNPGETVLDPFGGSGTSLVVAKKLNRKFIGFELSSNYAKQIQKRLNVTQDGEALLGAKEPTVSAPSTSAGKTRGRTAALHAPPPITRRTPDEVNRGIAEAFFATRDGYPVDRMVADPDMNCAFLDVCRRLGVPGEPREWNRRLMNLRKAGYFKGLPRGRETSFPLEDTEFDRCKYACEMAIQKFRVEGKPLDDVLCDPGLAKTFDETVLSMLPEDISSLKARWYALRIRKKASDIRRDVGKLDTKIPMPRSFVGPFDLTLTEVPTTPGIYWLRSSEKESLYVAEVQNLRERFEYQFWRTRFDFWGRRSSLQLAFKPVGESQAGIVITNHAYWIRELRPQWNFSLAFNPQSLAKAS